MTRAIIACLEWTGQGQMGTTRLLSTVGALMVYNEGTVVVARLGHTVLEALHSLNCALPGVILLTTDRTVVTFVHLVSWLVHYSK